MTRKLASMQQVLEVLPIEGADNIELVTVLGWQCVVKKGEFKPGDLGVYFEIDSVVPDTEPFAFLKGKLRVRTTKLRGQLSQGLMLPCSMFFDLQADDADSRLRIEGWDLTDALGVQKYEPPQPGQPAWHGVSTKRPRDFPYDVPKTDEERIQSQPRLLQKLAGKPFVITLKMDGCSATYLTHEGKFTVCSRNCQIPECEENEGSLYWRVARKYPNLAWICDPQCYFYKHCEIAPWYAVQGEICAPGLQKNRTGVPDGGVEFYVFSLFDKRTQEYAPYDEMRRICEEAGVPVVPLVKFGPSFDHTKDSLLELAEGKYEGTNNEREGIVVRSMDTTPRERVSFKVISNRYLLKGGE